MAFAISRVIENVVVVVVVTTREGSLGSGPRLDWENLSDAKFCAASSLRVDHEVRATYRKEENIRRKGIRERSKELLMGCELERYNESCK